MIVSCVGTRWRLASSYHRARTRGLEWTQPVCLQAVAVQGADMLSRCIVLICRIGCHGGADLPTANMDRQYTYRHVDTFLHHVKGWCPRREFGHMSLLQALRLLWSMLWPMLSACVEGCGMSGQIRDNVLPLRKICARLPEHVRSCGWNCMASVILAYLGIILAYGMWSIWSISQGRQWTGCQSRKRARLGRQVVAFAITNGVGLVASKAERPSL
jgi:hypothetical protein